MHRALFGHRSRRVSSKPKSNVCQHATSAYQKQNTKVDHMHENNLSKIDGVNSAAQYENATSPPTCFFIASNVFPLRLHSSQLQTLTLLNDGRFWCLPARSGNDFRICWNERETKTAPLAIKDIVNSEIKIESLFTHLHVFPNLLHKRDTMGSKQHWSSLDGVPQKKETHTCLEQQKAE